MSNDDIDIQPRSKSNLSANFIGERTKKRLQLVYFFENELSGKIVKNQLSKKI